LLASLKSGGRIALVSDAGMPGVSDPGAWLAREAISDGFPVIPIPGANAAVSALVASGLPTNEFHFVGFLPEKAGARRTRLEELAASAKGGAGCTLIFYEAPHRILDTLADLESVWGPELRVVVARELTKIHEEFLRATVAEARRDLASRDRVRGEITLLVAPPAPCSPDAQMVVAGPKVAVRIAQIQADAGVDEKEALKRLARELGQSKSDVYRELQRERARLSAGSRGTRNTP